ncbi:pyrroline-5-carboxylate reductase [Beggiatoa alba B18LD]|uniref:Pyrroline-5-carboxylate reductase n=1 Tax=Beggiatoa alba B18LD TaxID=395493 RepID=I3CBM8_9GAMM|nr:pyrroline-5-carboxylate reductase [Beggiatoa alba]EIJ41021.1 pyrroline-5-carboxylate reductase [Beggiatoa alba B18LD]
MKESIISFIGGGNMATSLIGGLLQTGVPAKNLRVSDINPHSLASRFPIQCFSDNLEAIQDADVIVLAVKPQIMAEVAKTIATALPERNPLFISIAAGIRVADLNRWLGDGAIPIVRVMPNTPALVQSGASALYASEHVRKEQHELAESILRAVGLTVWLTDENLIDVVTALSGSGPAYFFLLMEVLEKAGIQLGLPQETARLLTLQTAFGAAKMALESNEDAALLRERVTSKGGTTEQAIKSLQAGNIQAMFDRALQAAQKRATQMANEYGEQA